MSAIILTAKHHDGFCLWPSQGTAHDVAASSWRDGRGDVLAELSAACREADLKFGVYLSPWDQNHPDYGNSAAYNEFFESQLRETLGNYGPVFEVWFDGACGEGPNGRRQEYDWDGFQRVVREMQPDAVIFHGNRPDLRWVGNERGYAGETNWCTFRGAEYVAGAGEKPAELNSGHEGGTHWIPSECDVSIRPGWYYHADQDLAVKGLDELEDIYYGSVGRGSNLLLNLPVDRRGLVHENDAERLLELGRLLRATFDRDLAAGATVQASNVRGGDPAYAAEWVLDEDPDHYWGTDDDVRKAFLDLRLRQPSLIDRVMIQEPIHLGQRIRAFRVQARVDGTWRDIAAGTTIGYKRILRTQPVVADSIRLIVDDALACPLISRLALYAAPPKVRVDSPEYTFLDWTRAELFSNVEQAEIRYTLDGSPPTGASELYRGPLLINFTCTLKARAFLPGNPGLDELSREFRAYTRESLADPIKIQVVPNPGLRVSVFEPLERSLAELEGREPSSSSVTTRINLDACPDDGDCALVFEGYVNVPADGIFGFFALSADGSRVFLDGTKILDNDGLHGALEVMGEVGLKAGWHPLRVEYFGVGAIRRLQLQWRGPGVSKSDIPPERLGHL